jgi:hypothetical protein
MDLIEIKSAFIQAVGYDELNKHLRVMIKNNFYDHYEVPNEVYQDFINAKSKGSFYNKNIRGKYV